MLRLNLNRFVMRTRSLNIDILLNSEDIIRVYDMFDRTLISGGGGEKVLFLITPGQRRTVRAGVVLERNRSISFVGVLYVLGVLWEIGRNLGKTWEKYGRNMG